MDSKQSKMNILMLPFLAHGHITPFLELAKKLSHKNFHIYFCSTPINLKSIKKRITEKYSLSIELVEIHLPSLPELPLTTTPPMASQSISIPPSKKPLKWPAQTSPTSSKH
ncbi:hypothetical protein CsSME_00000424 [Camellia sinensis var. sinensis]